MNSARIAGLCAAFPRRRLAFQCDPSRVNQTIRRSDLRSLDSAVQSRVGDGFLAVRSDGSESHRRNPLRVARLPEHEVRDESDGAGPAVDDDVPRPGPQRWGERENLLRLQVKRSRAAGRAGPAQL